jgi:hypothetical protein
VRRATLNEFLRRRRSLRISEISTFFREPCLERETLGRDLLGGEP